MISKSEEKARQLYRQCQEAYDEYIAIPGHGRSILEYKGEEIDLPNPFYDPYNVPAELLHQEVRGHTASDDDRMDFEYKLAYMMHKHLAFDTSLLKSDASKGRYRQYTVYFEVFYSQSQNSRPLFSKQLTLSGVTYRWCSLRRFSRIVDILESYDDTGKGLYYQRCRERFSLPVGSTSIISRHKLHQVQATVTARSDIEATNLVSRKFSNYIACVNVIQAMGTQAYTSFSTGPKTKHKTCIASVDVFLVEPPQGEVQILIDTSRQLLPTVQLSLTQNDNKMKRLKTLVKSFDNTSPAAKRLQNVTLELYSAFNTDNPNLRQLSYWRCLELASAFQGQQSRPEREIIKIFQNYYPNRKYWAQIGVLIKDLRNNYVHRGISSGKGEPSEHHLNWSQRYGESAFLITLYLYEHRKVWSTNDDIDTFFNHYSQSNHSLELASALLAARSSK